MQTTNTRSYPAPDLVKNNWEFTEVWIDPMLSPPYILLLLCDSEGNCQIYDPKQGEKVVFSSNNFVIMIFIEEYGSFLHLSKKRSYLFCVVG